MKPKLEEEKKKKYVVAFPFLATTFLILALSLAVLAQSTAEKPTADSFGVEDASGRSGTYVEVPVSITNVTNGPIQGIRLRIDYKESVLNLTNISNGDLTSNWTHPQLGEDRHTMVIATANTEDAIPNESSGSVVLLNFHVIGLPRDTSPVNMTLIELSSPDGEVGRTAPAGNGTFTVTQSGETTPTPTPTSPNDGGSDGGSGGGSSGGSVPTTPMPPPTEKSPAIPSETQAPAFTPTIAPAPTPAQTPAPAIPAAQVPVISWSIIMIATFISVIIVLTGYLLIRKMS
jgi:hypothetical protein